MRGGRRLWRGLAGAAIAYAVVLAVAPAAGAQIPSSLTQACALRDAADADTAQLEPLLLLR